jgi:hypothetical protein
MFLVLFFIKHQGGALPNFDLPVPVPDNKDHSFIHSFSRTSLTSLFCSAAISALETIWYTLYRTMALLGLESLLMAGRSDIKKISSSEGAVATAVAAAAAAAARQV